MYFHLLPDFQTRIRVPFMSNRSWTNKWFTLIFFVSDIAKDRSTGHRFRKVGKRIGSRFQDGFGW